jgi:hypothetical protein
MRAHAERFGMPSPPKRIIATGGASTNQSILSGIASIFGCDVYTVERPGKKHTPFSIISYQHNYKFLLNLKFINIGKRVSQILYFYPTILTWHSQLIIVKYIYKKIQRLAVCAMSTLLMDVG